LVTAPVLNLRCGMTAIEFIEEKDKEFCLGWSEFTDNIATFMEEYAEIKVDEAKTKNHISFSDYHKHKMRIAPPENNWVKTNVISPNAGLPGERGLK